MAAVVKTSHSTMLLAAAFLLLGWNALPATAAESAAQIPPQVENEAQNIEAKFNSVLSQECASHLCTPVGCEVTAFKTLDEKQNSSLPGLDMSDEAAGAPGTDLQYKLSAMRCEFAYEPMLSDEAVATLRKRLSDKVRSTGVVLAVQGRKLSAANPLLKESQTSGPNAPLTPPLSAGGELARGLGHAMPPLLFIVTLTAGLLMLIWAWRRLGKDKPAPEVVEAAATTTAEDATQAQGPSAFEVMNKKERLGDLLKGSADLAVSTLQPIVDKGDVEELCRVLKHFGPEPLTPFATRIEYRDLFTNVHARFGEESFDEDNVTLMKFFEKLERLIALAQLGRPQAPLAAELAFLRDLAPDEFSVLASGFDQEELLAILSFVPTNLRTHYLQTRDARFVDTFVQHVLQHPRLSEQMLRRLAQRLHEQYAARHGEIKRVSRDQLTQIEQLLNTLGQSQRRQLYTSLRKDNPDLFERLSSEILLDRALVNTPEPVLNDLFLTLTPDEGAAYLQAHPDSKSILAKLKGPLAQAIRARFELRSNSGLNFIEDADPLAEQARLRINEVLRHKSANGEVNLRRINESVMDSI